MNVTHISSSIAIISFAVSLSSCGISSKLRTIKPASVSRFSIRDLLPATIPVISVDESKWISNEISEEKLVAESADVYPSQDLDLPTELPLEVEQGLLPPKPQ